MSDHGRRRWAVGDSGRLLGGVALALGLALAAPGAFTLAQDDPVPHPIHIHAGTCADLGDIVAPLGDVVALTEGDAEGAGSAVPVQISDTEVDGTLADILANPFAINVHESADNIEEYIACGDIGGRVDNGRLVIGLQEMNGSDFSGVAVLDEDKLETEVSVYLFEEGAIVARESAPAAADVADEPATAEPTAEASAEPTAEAPAEPTAEPEAAAPAGEEVAVDIRDFAFDPTPVEIAVGDTVTWTNQDGVPHTATGEDRDVLQSGAIAAGGTFSQTFADAGEFAYFCEFHAGMNGSVVVSE